MSNTPRKLKFHQEVQGTSVDLDVMMADLEDKENSKPVDVNVQQQASAVKAASASELHLPREKSKSKSKI